jgi:flotillin
MLGLIIGVSVVVVLGIVALLVAITFRRVVDTNMIHIVQRSDKSIPYGRGQEAGNAYYEWPTSLPKIGVTVAKLKSSIFQIDLEKYGAYDEAKVPFVVDIASFFRIEEPEKAAMRVKSFEELEEQLKNVLQGSVRKVLANNPLEKTMESRGELGKQFTAEVKDQLAEWGVIPVKSIEFMDLQDAEGSKVIQNIMAKEQSRIEKDSRIEIAENEAKAQNSEIENQRKIDIEIEVAAQQVGERKAQKDKAVGIADEQAKQEVQSQAAVTAEKDMAVIRVQQVKKSRNSKRNGGG